MSKVVDIYDDVFEEHNAIILDDNMKQLLWKYDYHSNPKEVNKHWHLLCGHNKEECDTAGYDWADEMFDLFKTKFGFKDKYMVEDYVRIYCNAHTHGLEPHMHTDDGDFTMIYYPRLDWKPDAWGGGTLIDGQLVPYKGNRLVVFDAYLDHKAMPVSRECYELRNVVVFKCNVKGVQTSSTKDNPSWHN
jgi:hypothetical protein